MTNTLAGLERELRGMQEMLFFVLQAVGHPVEVTKEALQNGTRDQMINVDDDIARDVFVFSITEIPDEVH